MMTTVSAASRAHGDASAPSTAGPLPHLLGRGADHTVTEIAQQPQLWRQVGRDVVAWHERDVVLRKLLARPGLRVVLTGAGTSAFAGEVVAPVLRRRRGHRVDAVPTTDILSNPRECFAEDVPTLLVSFARSGDSPESVAATELAEQCLSECHHLIITCNPDGRLARDHANRVGSCVLLMPAAADDQGFAMTSSFTCMLLTALLVLGGADAPIELADRLAAAVQASLAERAAATAELAASGRSRIVYLGSGALKGLARESALKVLELTAGRVTATAESALGFRHGPKAVLDDDTLALVYLSGDPYTRRYDLDILAELQAAQPAGSVVAISAAGDDLPAGGPRWLLPELAGVDDAAFAAAAVVSAQLVGLQFSLAHGIGSDNPFPAGEVNRVVHGVVVHPLDPAATESV